MSFPGFRVNHVAQSRPMSPESMVETPTLMFSSPLTLWFGSFDLGYVHLAKKESRSGASGHPCSHGIGRAHEVDLPQEHLQLGPFHKGGGVSSKGKVTVNHDL